MLHGDLIRILGSLMRRRDKFDRILIETTGMTDPGPVSQTFFVDEEIKTAMRLDGIITVVDAHHVEQHIDSSEEVREQIAFADVILLNKTDLTDTEKLTALEGRLRGMNALARAAAADGAYDTRLCHDELRRKKISALIPPRKGAGYSSGAYAYRNRAVANQRLSGNSARWKWTTEYNRRSIAETSMYRMKQLFDDSLTVCDYDGQVVEALAMVSALTKMTKAGIPESVRIA